MHIFSVTIMNYLKKFISIKYLKRNQHPTGLSSIIIPSPPVFHLLPKDSKFNWFWLALCVPSEFSQQPRTYIYVLHALFQHPLCLHFSNQRRIYPSSYCFACGQNILMLATKDVHIHPSCTLPAAKGVYKRPHKVNFYRCLVVGCVFLWLLSLDIWTFP